MTVIRDRRERRQPWWRVTRQSWLRAVAFFVGTRDRATRTCAGALVLVYVVFFHLKLVAVRPAARFNLPPQMLGGQPPRQFSPWCSSEEPVWLQQLLFVVVAEQHYRCNHAHTSFPSRSRGLIFSLRSLRSLPSTLSGR